MATEWMGEEDGKGREGGRVKGMKEGKGRDGWERERRRGKEGREV